MKTLGHLRLSFLSGVAVLGITTIGTATSAAPRSTGVDSIHSQVRVGSKVCMATHSHYGEAEMASRSGAAQAAIRNWQVFTADEYGTIWGSYRLAIRPSMSCQPTSGNRWFCKTSAYPCRPA